jgi:small-conductance mechanosensitive channel
MENLPDFLRATLAVPWVRALLVLLVALLAGKLADLFLCGLLARAARRTNTDLDDRLIALLHRPIFVTVVLIGLYVALRILDPGPEARRVIVAAILTVAILIWTSRGLRIITILLEGTSRLADRAHWLDARTVPLFENVAKILLVGGAIYCLLVAWNLNIAPWLASAGIVGIALGFAAKDSLANLFGGIFVIIDAPYKIGDYINLDSGERGQVVKIGLRSTRLLTRDDIEITVPNAQIASAKIINESGGPYEKTRVTVYVGVAYGSDVDRVRDVLLRAARSVEHVLDDPEPRVRFSELGDSALIFRVLCWIEEPAVRGQCIDGLNSAVYKGLAAEGISIPFPQRDVHVHQTPPATG